jgi:hypothetical protein
VADTFTSLHNLISAPQGTDNFATIIRLGDYNDLPSLTIGSEPVINDVDLSPHGRLLRLMVVGINSFNGINSNNTPHVVFQFQNTPVEHNMNNTDTNTGGYKASAMQGYIMGGFLTGLKAATGLTGEMLWGPTRKVSKGGSPEVGTDDITDTLWLPTEWEMLGERKKSSETYEPSEGQARLEYYDNATKRKKYNSANDNSVYWLASPDSSSAANFAIVNYNGNVDYCYASFVAGCAPAFCVK